ncbi:MAG TPA: hypothetical protein VH575_21895 [Gemmataceae bacterium]|jgi:hypothetical protein
MESPQRSSRRRETFLALSLAVALGCFLALYFLLIGGRYFLAVLAVLAGAILLGFLQYLLWGWPMSRSTPKPTRTTRLSR